METELEESRYKITETENINKNLKEEINSVQNELQSTKEQLEEILKNKKMFVMMQSPRVYRDWETDRKSTRLNSSHRL